MYRQPVTGEAETNLIYRVNQRSYNGKEHRQQANEEGKRGSEEGRTDEERDGKPSGEEEI